MSKVVPFSHYAATMLFLLAGVACLRGEWGLVGKKGLHPRPLDTWVLSQLRRQGRQAGRQGSLLPSSGRRVGLGARTPRFFGKMLGGEGLGLGARIPGFSRRGWGLRGGSRES